MLFVSGLEADFDIQRTIQLVRAQRSGMVQTEVSTIIMIIDHYYSSLLPHYYFSNNTNLYIRQFYIMWRQVE